MGGYGINNGAQLTRKPRGIQMNLWGFGCMRSIHVPPNKRDYKLQNGAGTNDIKGKPGIHAIRRIFQMYQNVDERQNRGTSYALVAICIAMIGFSFACVPLYEYLCQQSGFFGATKRVKTYAPPPKVRHKRLFEVDLVTQTNIGWKFHALQRRLVIAPGETTLAFYTAKNILNEPVIGIAAYRVIPDEAARYFNKIQCFCFEEQLLGPGEEVDLPVLFFLDPDILNDRKLAGVDKITLAYTFFKAGSEIPPEYTAWLRGNDDKDKNTG